MNPYNKIYLRGENFNISSVQDKKDISKLGNSKNVFKIKYLQKLHQTKDIFQLKF